MKAALILFALASASAHAQTSPPPTPLPDLSPPPAERPLRAAERDPVDVVPAQRRRPEVNVGEAPGSRTQPPSDDKRYQPRTRTEWTWQNAQRGTNATGLGPVPSTGGQPGTLQ